MKNKIINIFWSWVVFIVIILLWYLVSHHKLVFEVLIPTPFQVYRAFVELFGENKFLDDVFISVIRVVVGFTLASILAVPIGIMMAVSRKTQTFLEPFIDFIRYTPVPAFIPLFILWFGIGELGKIIIIFATVFFQLVLMVVNSVLSVPQNIIDSARTLGVDNRNIVLKIIFPYVKPRIFEDFRISIGWAWAGLIVAEMIGSVSGVGFVIIQSQRLLQTDKVMAVIIVVGIMGVVSDYLFRILYRILFPWSLKFKLYD